MACEECDPLRGRVADLQEQISRMSADVASLQAQNLGNLRRISALNRELAETVGSDPTNAEVKEVLQYWKSVLMPKAKIPSDGARAKRVMSRLKDGYTVEQIKQAVDGCARSDWHRRNAKVDIELICRNEAILEEFIAKGAPRTQGRKGRTLDEFLHLLDNVRKSGDNRYSARCPAHDDRQNSLSVAMGNKGILVRCFAGCDFTDVARAVGMAPTDFFEEQLDARPLVLPASPAPIPLPSDDELAYAHGRLMASLQLVNRLYELKGWTREAIAHFNLGFDGKRIWIPVRDKDNQLVNIIRYHPGGQSPKSLALAGRPRDLFPGPELRGESIWLVEGEPDAISGYVLGLAAVGVPGVQGWKDAYINRLRGREVTICFDCDDPGRGAAMKVEAALKGAGVRVRRVDLDPRRKDGYDLSDYLVGGGSRERLMLL